MKIRDGVVNLSSTIHHPDDEHTQNGKPEFVLSVRAGGNLTKLRPLDRRSRNGGRQDYGACRGKAMYFSPRSAERFRQFLGEFRRDALAQGWAVTLTYPAQAPNLAIAKQHKEAWIKRLQRKYGETSTVIWRLGFQERGAPHFHLIVLGIPELEPAWVAQSWYDTVGSGDTKHLAAGTETGRIRNPECAVAYIARAEGRAPAHVDSGRWWGMRGNKTAHKAPLVECQITRVEAAKLARNLDKRRRARARMTAEKTGNWKVTRRARRRKCISYVQSTVWRAPDTLSAQMLSRAS